MHYGLSVQIFQASQDLVCITFHLILGQPFLADELGEVAIKALHHQTLKLPASIDSLILLLQFHDIGMVQRLHQLGLTAFLPSHPHHYLLDCYSLTFALAKPFKNNGIATLANYSFHLVPFLLWLVSTNMCVHPSL